MTDDDTDDETEEMVGMYAKVPESLKQAAKEQLPHGGISKVVRESLRYEVFGPGLGTRSRLEREIEKIDDELTKKRAERRDINTEIENLEQRRANYEKKISNLSSKEDKYEAKLEGLESRLLDEATRLWTDHPAVKDAAVTGEVDPEAVVEDLKERNPEVPDYAFQQGLHDTHDWHGRESLDESTNHPSWANDERRDG